MYRSSSSRVFPTIIIIVVVIALIAGLFTLGKYIFSGNSKDKDEEQTKIDVARDQLTTIDVDRRIRLSVRGPIVAKEKFRTHQITITPSSRSYTVFGGYKDTVEKEELFENNVAAYEQFVFALDKAALTKPGKKAADSDLRGICATGNIYEFELYDGNTILQRYWTSDCKGSPGNFGADLSQNMNLFIRQIPKELPGFRTSAGRISF